MDHLINWRLYDRYSRGHMAELASHMVAITDWFFGADAESTIGSGGVFRGGWGGGGSSGGGFSGGGFSGGGGSFGGGGAGGSW